MVYAVCVSFYNNRSQDDTRRSVTASAQARSVTRLDELLVSRHESDRVCYTLGRESRHAPAELKSEKGTVPYTRTSHMHGVLRKRGVTSSATVTGAQHTAILYRRPRRSCVCVVHSRALPPSPVLSSPYLLSSASQRQSGVLISRRHAASTSVPEPLLLD